MSAETTAHKPTLYERFTRAQRIEHILLIISFLTLCFTGLPQKYAGAAWAEGAIALMGGIQLVRIIHRIAATMFILEMVYHAVVIVYKLYVERVRPTMMPGVKDATDAWQALTYNLGIGKRRPRMGRYTFEEKAEYWAMAWGSVVMIITGFMLWNPIATARVLPGQFIPAAKAAHGGEALLAFLAILLWHFYHVHIRHLNKSIFTGNLTRHEMENEHPLELEAIERGEAGPKNPPEVIARRRRAFLPVAGVISLALVALTLYFVTFEESAIETVPVANQGLPAVATQTATPIPTAPAEPTRAPAQGGGASDALVYDGAIGALFIDKCASCHGALGGFSVESYAELMAGGAKGVQVIPGNADSSPLVILQASGDHPGKFTADELALIKEWINDGAPESE